MAADQRHGSEAEPVGEIQDGPPPAAAPRERFVRVVGKLWLVNGAVLAAALITSPLQARALGPEGRGDLAAILVSLAFITTVGTLGLGSFANRAVASGRPTRTILGTLAPVAIVLGGLIGVVAGTALADLVAGDREIVFTYVRIGLFLLPLAFLGGILAATNSGLERWRSVMQARLIPPLSGLLAISVLYAADALTVGSAAIVALAGGTASILPLLGVLRGGGRLKFDSAVVRESLSFAAKAWVSVLGRLGNSRLDQLLMTRLASSRELGLYAVAVNIAEASEQLAFALVPVLFTRVAAGNREITARALRVALTAVSLVSAMIALVTPLVLTHIFGPEFRDAMPMTWILLISAPALVGTAILATSLTGAGRPGAAARAQIIALGVNVPLLLLLVPSMGGVGAALASLAAYTANFTILLASARRQFEGRVRDFLLFKGEDLAWTRDLVRSAVGALRRAV